MNSRLEAVEVQVAEGKSDKQVKWRRTVEQSKISNNDILNVRKPGKNLPHEAILRWANRTRVTHNQLSLSQWVQGFAQNIKNKQTMVSLNV